MKSGNSTYNGQKVYTSTLLRVYDLWVLGISNSFIWECPTQKLLAFFNKQVSGKHLDVGVGTGFFLDRCHFPVQNPEIVLADLNKNSLNWAAKRIKRYQPKKVELDILKPISLPNSTFDSISIQYLLHCLPGNMKIKEKVFLNLKPYLSESGVIFGATILGSGLKKSKVAEKLMNFYNSKGIFSNKNDNIEDLSQILRNNFNSVHIESYGCVALFSARR